MPEDREPFVHQNDIASPAYGSPPSNRLLTPSALARAVHVFEQAALHQPSRDFANTLELLRLLQKPSVNVALLSILALDEATQAVAAGVALALWADDRRRPRLAAELRALLERAS